MSTTTTQSTKVITGLVRFSYAHVWEPTAVDESSEKKYSISLIIPKSDKKSIALINAAINAAKEEGKAKLGGKIPANLKLPLRDGDVERPDDEAYANSYFLNANAKNKPGIVDVNRKPIMDQEEFYSGCYGHASVTFFAFNTSGNKGIGVGLNNLMKVKEGERLGGRASAEEDFGDLEIAGMDSDVDDLM
jgi:hypothetical protein